MVGATLMVDMNPFQASCSRSPYVLDRGMQPYEELFALTRQLNEIAERGKTDELAGPVRAIERASAEVARSFSGSWLGYHSRVYYAGLKPPPPGAAFSQEWGSESSITGMGTRGDWREFSLESVIAHIMQQAGSPDMEKLHAFASEAEKAFDQAKSDCLSILSGELSDRADGFLEGLRSEIQKLKIYSSQHFIEYAKPKGQFISRDMLALGQGIVTPPHMFPASESLELQGPPTMCATLSDKISKAASHLERQARKKRTDDRVGTNVFIGHGRSPTWRELKDFVGERLKLPWDEFNRVPVAGVTNIARLSEMLDAAAIAFLVMTAEDEMLDGGIQARMNVVHEAGLFQGRLGFTKAIVLLEEGCAEFSNIQGLGQIRFPKGNIAACFEEVRRVLEREELVEA